MPARRGAASTIRVPLQSLRRLTACLCLVAQLAGLAHLLLAQHSLCAAHGELVERHHDADRQAAHVSGHSDRVRTPSDAAENTASTTSTTASARDQHGRAISDEHDHCVLAHLHRGLLLPTLTGAVEAPLAKVLPTLPPPAPRTLRPRRLYQLAPKTSPPPSDRPRPA